MEYIIWNKFRFNWRGVDSLTPEGFFICGKLYNFARNIYIVATMSDPDSSKNAEQLITKPTEQNAVVQTRHLCERVSSPNK